MSFCQCKLFFCIESSILNACFTHLSSIEYFCLHVQIAFTVKVFFIHVEVLLDVFLGYFEYCSMCTNYFECCLKYIASSLYMQDYKKIEDILRQYQKTRRWAHYKVSNDIIFCLFFADLIHLLYVWNILPQKKVMQEVLAARKMRFPNLYEHHMGVGRGMPCTKRE